jgi:hypothetical protein
MVFRVVLFVWEFLMDVLAVSRLGDEEKELELLLLRQQLRMWSGNKSVGRRFRGGRRYHWRC